MFIRRASLSASAFAILESRSISSRILSFKLPSQCVTPDTLTYGRDGLEGMCEQARQEPLNRYEVETLTVANFGADCDVSEERFVIMHERCDFGQEMDRLSFHHITLSLELPHPSHMSGTRSSASKGLVSQLSRQPSFRTNAN